MEFLLHHLLESAAERRPGEPAVVDRARTLTYDELETESNRLARLLMDQGVRPGDRVGLFLDKSIESIIAIYAVLKGGGIYVPLDPQAPIGRVAYVTGNCGIEWLLTGKEKAGSWAELARQAPQVKGFVVLNGEDRFGEHAGGKVVLDRGAIEAQVGARPAVARIGFDPAYILYTSGSTGNPKGVTLTHRNAMSFVDWGVDEYGVTAADRLSNHAPLHFDLSIFDIFAAARAGGTLVLVPPEISVFPIEVARFIERSQITVWYSVPSLLSRMSEKANLHPGSLPRLRTILFAGEVFPVKYLRKLMLQLPHVRFSNLYGPTETNVCTWYDVSEPPDEVDGPIPIGRAIADIEVFALKDDGTSALAGEVGELIVRGPTVMQGYWNDQERTDRGLVPDPLGTPQKVYRTGDLVRQDDSGCYRLLGRRDAQIKSRGYRIELGEIETALYRHPAVVECAAIAVPDEMITNRLVAIVGLRYPVDPAALYQWCADIIPRYMIPETFEAHDSLPKTSTGKIDRQALARAFAERTASAAAREKEGS
ncbi:MAG TPA: amino acid adenylation domain-containing protein [Candidatus Dormibacteraeota bacterium]|nr:amino acid adenylation domain-containing protein [Candidatus Dormibacteraeota bacterium]